MAKKKQGGKKPPSFPKKENKANDKKGNLPEKKGAKSKDKKTTTTTRRVKPRKQGQKRGPKAKKTIIEAKPIEYNKKALNEIKNSFRDKKGRFLTREKRIEILQEKERLERRGKTFKQIAKKIASKNPNIKAVLTGSAEKTFHYTSGDFIDRATDGKTKVIIKDFEGNEATKKGHTTGAAIKKLRDYNNALNRAIRAAQSHYKKANPRKYKNKPPAVYIQVNQIEKISTDGEVLAVEFDYSNLTITGDLTPQQFLPFLDIELGL
jgi:hypothetical protein